MAFTALPNLAQNLGLAWCERVAWPSTRDLPVLGVTGFVGAVLGAIVLVPVPEEPLVSSCSSSWSSRTPRCTSQNRSSRSRSVHAPGRPSSERRRVFSKGRSRSGPVVASWIHSYRLPQRAYILSVTGLFALAGAAQLTVLAGGGEMDGRWTAAVVACGLTIPIESRHRGRLNAERFDQVVILVLAASVLGLAIQRLG